MSKDDDKPINEPIIAMPGAKVEIGKKGKAPKSKKSVAIPEVASKEADFGTTNLLSDDDKERLKKKARDNVLADMKKEAEEAFLSREERKEIIRRKQKIGETDQDELVNFVCDLADYAAYIMVNNVTYYHGFSYKVPRHVCRGLMDIAARTWDHDADIHGEKYNPRKKRNQRLSMRDSAA
jgi:hypothetical protein